MYPSQQKERRRRPWNGPRKTDASGRSVRDLSGWRLIEELSIPEPNTGCWLWLGRLDRNGYACVSDSVCGTSAAHRYSLILSVGDIGDMWALHRCDQPSCVNPAHLYAGTPQDNTNDMIRRGRMRVGHQPRGSATAQAKLTESDVREIRSSYVKRSRQNGLKALASRFGVKLPTVFNIINGDTWRHVK